MVAISQSGLDKHCRIQDPQILVIHYKRVKADSSVKHMFLLDLILTCTNKNYDLFCACYKDNGNIGKILSVLEASLPNLEARKYTCTCNKPG